MRIRILLTLASTSLSFMLLACGGSGTAESERPQAIADLDRDGVADANDCAPQDAQAWQTLAFSARNDDGDIARVNTSGQLCGGASLPPTRFAAAAPANEIDCDDGNPGVWANLTYQSVDTDRDGFAAARAGSICAGAALPEAYRADLPAMADLDCNDDDATKWRLSAYSSRDDDGDGYRVAASGTLCGQGTLPANLFAQAATPLQLDCDDANASRWNWHLLYRDADGDGIGSGGAIHLCLGNTISPGLVSRGYDPNDSATDPAATIVNEQAIDSSMLAVSDDGDDDDVFF